ncbi:hypothetical protein BASA50_008016 [Batrachochytrium salamandrivorans]|uniref:EamA domain-containing protein n=1 Tax=Batrachochytrium salamandrivorans TaxID=1357716 RepID=A0ABQ8F5G3_9FUNG|nr:hypothetical protein BASA62_005332 [Batrachochytrium salamandrivorans]KAH6572595.1 hypothetical protein BASA60_006564 [Batrachochytrium salamandrivorans]KAH6592565.1 hypothetical protein BASA50_008016 [Batrachochytrium salamandrivorans]KAH6598339.1 hypothetical protein BASA61_002894 [Batrachochytrium salamandrivorans]KAH9245400.1 hypothetical protein BASA81_017134 [Batrachochytrium salamandrivorans]
MKQSLLVFLVVGMLFTGTINTLLNKLQDLTCVAHCDNPDKSLRHYFEQPLWQTLNMFIGEAACLIVYYGAMFFFYSSQDGPNDNTATNSSNPSHSSATSTAEPTVDERTPLVPSTHLGTEEIGTTNAACPPLEGWLNLLFLFPTLCDLTATTFMNIGLVYISASIYQMLRGSVVLFTGTLSVLFLGRRHPLYRWFALITVVLGVAIVGLSGIMTSPASDHTPSLASDYSNNITLLASSTDGMAVQENPAQAGGYAVGIFLVVLAQIFTALQFVLEEKIMAKYEVPALKAVGLEGLFGLICVAIGMPMLHYAFGVHGPPGNYFDMFAGYHMVVDHPQVLWAGVGIIFSIAFFNWLGLSVTRNISATSRSTIDTCRTLFIWMASLALQWESFKWLQVVGFCVLIYGTFVFNDVVKPPPCIPAAVPNHREERVHEE